MQGPPPPEQQPPAYVAYQTEAAQLPGDPVRLPLQLLIAGWAVLIVGTLLGTALTEALIQMGSMSSAFSVVSSIRSVIGTVGEALLVAGAGLLARAKRPGHQLAVVAAIAYGVSILFTGIWIVVGMVSASIGAFHVVSFASAIVDTVALGALVLALRSLGRSRERPIDAVVIVVLTWLGVSLLLSLATNVAEVRMPRQAYYVTVLVNIGVRIALMASMWRIVSFVPLADPTMGDGSAYRGPMAAWQGAAQDEGSVGLGFLAGFFGGCIGAGLVFAIAKGPATKRGAGIGFACHAVLGIIMRLALSRH